MYWVDSCLTWDPEEYGGISVVVMQVDEIWTPDFIIDVKIKDVSTKYCPSVYSDGRVRNLTPHVARLGCPMNIKGYNHPALCLISIDCCALLSKTEH